jgi:tRNA threonylcarbamoyladenosine biosynthesis protein TsaB
LILSIDTSTQSCSIALHNNGELLALSSLFVEKSHSSMLTILIENTLKNAGLAIHELDAIAVAKGPGSYTGLRIGVSTAKGLCLALEKPLIAINSLEAMALQLNGLYDNTHLLCPMIDARRLEVYCLIADNLQNTIENTQAKIIDEQSFLEHLEHKKMIFFGDGAKKCSKIITHKNAFFPNISIHPSAETIGKMATTKYTNQAFENLVTFEPFYLKEFIGTQPKKNSIVAP